MLHNLTVATALRQPEAIDASTALNWGGGVGRVGVGWG